MKGLLAYGLKTESGIGAACTTFEACDQEFYRRLAAPYEDRQRAKNGDVDLYVEYVREIEKME